MRIVPSSAIADPFLQVQPNATPGPGQLAAAIFYPGMRPWDFPWYVGTEGIISITPNYVAPNNDWTLVVSGYGLTPGFTLTIGGVDVTGRATLINSTEIDVEWQGFTLPTGVYDVVYTSASGPDSTLTAAFGITA
jgi:hypothetical protein